MRIILDTAYKVKWKNFFEIFGEIFELVIRQDFDAAGVVWATLTRQQIDTILAPFKCANNLTPSPVGILYTNCRAITLTI